MLLTRCAAIAQNPIPNAGFENWTNFGLYDEPNDWTITSNYVSFQDTIITSFKSTQAHSGQYALKLKARTFYESDSNGTAIAGDNAIASLIHPILPNQFPGFPIPNQPPFLSGYYQYDAWQGDTCTIMVIPTLWNPILGYSEGIGLGVFQSATPTNGYTPFSIPINYAPGYVPDSAIIVLVSSSLDSLILITGNSGTFLVDDLAYTGTILALPREDAFAEPLLAYPNPSQGFTRLQLPARTPENAALTITDLQGRVVYYQEKALPVAGPPVLPLDLRHLPAGLYLVSLSSADNWTARTKLVVKQ